jgi:hypothetical protein
VSGGEVRDGVSLTNLDQPLFEGAEAAKRDLVDYLDAVAGHIIPQLRDRPLSVVRVLRGQDPFMQKNVPKYTPPRVRTVTLWAESCRARCPTRSATIAARCCGQIPHRAHGHRANPVRLAGLSIDGQRPFVQGRRIGTALRPVSLSRSVIGSGVPAVGEPTPIRGLWRNIDSAL